MKINSSVKQNTVLGSSFRDPAGYIYKNSKGEILRQINNVGQKDFEMFIQSGLYDSLVADGMIISHKTEELVQANNKKIAASVIKPTFVPFISYPFEWAFSQLQDAALLTLAIQKRALKYGMTLKDASAYNIQFINGKPVFIDTLSFEKYETGTPWQAYHQYCQHFLAPLALSAYTDINLPQLLRIYLDGIPLELTNKLLPLRAKIKPGLAMHIVLHSKAQKAKSKEHKAQSQTIGLSSLLAIIDSLEQNTKKLKPLKAVTEWGDYYDNTNYTPSSADKKTKLLSKFAKQLKAKTALDLGGNNGEYSRVLNNLGISTICTDIDPVAVEANYRYSREHKIDRMLPLLVDLTNPGGALGWHNDERETIQDRFQVDVVMALAIVHHLAISNNLPLEMIAKYFKEFGQYLIIEFVPKTDSQVKKLLSTRKDIFSNYKEEIFEQSFGNFYKLINKERIADTERTLYLFKRK